MEVKEYHKVTIGCKFISVMLEDNTRVKEVENLREIILVEADYNFVKKLLIGVNMTKEAKKEVVTPTDKCRGRKGHRKIESGPNKHIIFGISITIR